MWTVIVFTKIPRVYVFPDESATNAFVTGIKETFPGVKVARAMADIDDLMPAWQSHVSNKSDIDLLACLDHLITEGDCDNNLTASRAGVDLSFSRNMNPRYLEWVVTKAGRDNTPFSEAEQLLLGKHGFTRSDNEFVEGYSKLVPARLTPEIVAEARVLVKEVFDGKEEEPWLIDLCLQYCSVKDDDDGF